MFIGLVGLQERVRLVVVSPWCQKMRYDVLSQSQPLFYARSMLYCTGANRKSYIWAIEAIHKSFYIIVILFLHLNFPQWSKSVVYKYKIMQVASAWCKAHDILKLSNRNRTSLELGNSLWLPHRRTLKICASLFPNAHILSKWLDITPLSTASFKG